MLEVLVVLFVNWNDIGSFPYFGENPSFKHASNIKFRGKTRLSPQILIIRTDRSSHPCALFGFKERIILSIFFSETQKSVNEGALDKI